jgi:hypothetical protein
LFADDDTLIFCSAQSS